MSSQPPKEQIRFCPTLSCMADRFTVLPLGPEEWLLDDRWHEAATIPVCPLCGQDLSVVPSRELSAPMLSFLNTL